VVGAEAEGGGAVGLGEWVGAGGLEESGEEVNGELGVFEALAEGVGI
jgi:hypothetical protein